MSEIYNYIREIGAVPSNSRHLQVLNEFINADRAYLITRDEIEGYTFWLLTPEFSVRVGLVNGRMLSGKIIVSLLDSLVINNGDLEKTLAEVNLPQETLSIDTWRVKESPAYDTSDCYRTYMSTTDLEKILSFPDQPEYQPFRDIVIVTSVTSLRPGSLLQRITIPLEMIYTVICPDGVTCDPTVVKKGERLTLVFSKEGFTSQSLTLSAGVPSPFVKYDGAAILVTPLHNVGLNFIRRIPVKVRTSNGRALTGYEITVNGRPVNTSRPYIDLTERDLMPGQIVEILVTSTNYEALMVKLPAEKADVNNLLDLVLHPERQGIILRLNFSDGTTIEHEVFLERSDPKYRDLRAGSFCGFRSHLISNPGEPEKYNIDVRAGGKAMPVSVEAPKPVITPLPSAETDSVTEVKEEEKVVDTTPVEPKRKRRRRSYTPVWVICLGIVITVIIAALAVLYLPGLYKQYIGDDEVKPVLISEVTDSIAEELSENTPDTLPGIAESASIQAQEESIEERKAKAKAEAAAAALNSNEDMGYLKNNRVWKRSELTTDEGRQIFDLLTQGDIDAVINSPYFNSENAAINPTASKIADLLYQSKGTPTQRSNEVTLTKLQGADTIDLWTLYESLARLRPAEPNPGARP